MQVNAIVNAANSALVQGGGVCGAIFAAAGAAELQAACNRVAPVSTGYAAITPGFRLAAKYIIHAVGPVYRNHTPERSERLLRSAYTQSLLLALDHGCSSIAFPLISSGIYGYPKSEALQVATCAVRDFLEQYDMDVYLAVFDKASLAVSRELLGSVKSYIYDHYVDTHTFAREDYHIAERSGNMPFSNAVGSDKCKSDRISLTEAIGNLDEPFGTTLLRIIDSKGMTDVEVYKRANMDRKLFSKIRTGKWYMPSKRTVLALAVALELDLNETERLLKKAGYAISHSRKSDVIVEYFIINGRYDVFEINEVLFEYDQPLLGMN